jgi:hypothetical protein
MKQCKDCKEYIEDNASKCPKCKSRQEGLLRFAEWLQAWQTLILSLGFIIAIWQVQFTQKQVAAARNQIQENNRQVWSNYLSQKSLELSKLAIERDYLGCIYHWALEAVNANCADKIYRKDNIIPLLRYVDHLIEHFREANVYSKENDKTYYKERYEKWAENLGRDKYGIVRYALLNSPVCKRKGDCVYLSYDLRVCPEQSVEGCANWLDFGSKYFLSMTDKDSLRGGINLFSDLP